MFCKGNRRQINERNVIKQLPKDNFTKTICEFYANSIYIHIGKIWFENKTLKRREMYFEKISPFYSSICVYVYSKILRFCLQQSAFRTTDFRSILSRI